MWITTVQLSSELVLFLDLIFAECQPSIFCHDSDRLVYLCCLLRQLVRALGGTLPGEVYESFQLGNEEFQRKLKKLVHWATINANNIIAHRNLGSDQPPIDAD